MEKYNYTLRVTWEEFDHISQALAFYVNDNDRFIEQGMPDYTPKERVEQAEFSHELEALLINIEDQIGQQIKSMKEDDEYPPI